MWNKTISNKVFIGKTIVTSGRNYEGCEFHWCKVLCTGGSVIINCAFYDGVKR